MWQPSAFSEKPLNFNHFWCCLNSSLKEVISGPFLMILEVSDILLRCDISLWRCIWYMGHLLTHVEVLMPHLQSTIYWGITHILYALHGFSMALPFLFSVTNKSLVYATLFPLQQMSNIISLYLVLAPVQEIIILYKWKNY